MSKVINQRLLREVYVCDGCRNERTVWRKRNKKVGHKKHMDCLVCMRRVVHRRCE